MRLTRDVVASINRAYGTPSPEGWIRLNTNEGAAPPSPLVRSAIIESIGSLNRYASPFAEPFRTDVATSLAVEPEQVVVANGADGILSSCFRAFCEPSDVVSILDPTYPHLKNLALLSAARIQTAADPIALMRLSHRSAAKLTILVNPNSPLGSWVPASTIADEVPPDGLLIVDEAYSAFAPGDALSLLERDNVVVVRSFSKAYGLAGVRLGYAVTSVELAAALSRTLDPYPVNAMAIAAGSAALADSVYYDEYRAMVIDERRRMTSVLRDCGWTVLDSHANFIFVQPPDRSTGYYVDLLANRKVLVRTFDTARDGFRISIGARHENDVLLHTLTDHLSR